MAALSASSEEKEFLFVSFQVGALSILQPAAAAAERHLSRLLEIEVMAALNYIQNMCHCTGGAA
jgi:hypothetical protein